VLVNCVVNKLVIIVFWCILLNIYFEVLPKLTIFMSIIFEPVSWFCVKCM